MSKAAISMDPVLDKIEERVQSGKLTAACWNGEWRSRFAKWVKFIDKPILDFFLANPTIIVPFINRITTTIPSSRILEEVNASLPLPGPSWEAGAADKPCGHLVAFAVNWGYGFDGQNSKLAASLFQSCFVRSVLMRSITG